MTVMEVIEAIKAVFQGIGKPLVIPSLQGDSFEAELFEDGVKVHKLDDEYEITWSEFLETMNTMAGGPREAGFYITTVNGVLSCVVYGAQLSRPVHEKIVPLISVLIYAQICRYESGFIAG